MTKPSPWKKDPDDNPRSGEFGYEVTEYEVRRLIETLKRMTPSPERGFYILLAAMIHMVSQNNISKEELVKILADEILAHKVVEK